jgi:hypothetical protein
MADEPSIARDVLIDVSQIALTDLPEGADTGLYRALRRFLAAGDEADAIAEWSSALKGLLREPRRPC